MLKGYYHNYTYNERWDEMMIPSCYNFSLIFNRKLLFLTVIGISEILFVVGIVFHIGMIVTPFQVAIVIFIIYLLKKSYKINRLDFKGIVNLEKAYNAMSELERVTYAKYLIACYKDSRNALLRADAIKLFEMHTQKIEKPNRGAELKEVLNSVQNARSLADEIYNSSLRNRNV